MADIGLIAVKSKHLMKRMDLIMKYNADYYEKNIFIDHKRIKLKYKYR